MNDEDFVQWVVSTPEIDGWNSPAGGCDWQWVYPYDVGFKPPADNAPFWQCRSGGPCWHRLGPKVEAEIR